MVSTRRLKSRHFEKGERVLCYEPDPTKAKVLYVSKILSVLESKDRRGGRRILQYKVHFQGWSSSWDRKVGEDYLLEDTANNRQLQRVLAAKAQLQLDSHLYHKERRGEGRIDYRKHKSDALDLTFGCLTSTANTASAATRIYSAFKATDDVFEKRVRCSSEDNFSSSSTIKRHEQSLSMREECETESYCSSIESFHDEDRVLLRISERLRRYLDYDCDMIIRCGKQHILPSRMPIVAILEHFVKQSAIKLVSASSQTESTRRRTTQQRTDKKEREFDKLVHTVAALKEVADGLRIFFDFSLTEFLLYKEEKTRALDFLAKENLKNFNYIAPSLTPDMISRVRGSEIESTSLLGVAEGVAATSGAAEPQRRKLRSHRNTDDGDLTLENCLSSIASSSSGGSAQLLLNFGASNLRYLRSLQPMTSLSISAQTRDFLQAVLAWRLLPTIGMPAPSMIFGASHLARMIVKLPSFLNASIIPDDKLKILLQHMDSFIHYLEDHKEWFSDENTYMAAITPPCSNNSSARAATHAVTDHGGRSRSHSHHNRQHHQRRETSGAHQQQFLQQRHQLPSRHQKLQDLDVHTTTPTVSKPTTTTAATGGPIVT